MWSAEAVFVCALALLGRSENTFPPVQFVERVPAGVSPAAKGYAQFAEGRIVLITSTPAFTRARQARDECSDLQALRDIAGVLAHEEWHMRHGPDEQGAYHAQLIALTYVGAGPNSPLYYQVVKAMQAVGAGSKPGAQAHALPRAAIQDGAGRSSAAATSIRLRDGP